MVRVQSILIPKSWGLPLARAWIKSHGYRLKWRNKSVDITKHYYRFRQADPLRGRIGIQYFTESLPNGIRIIYYHQ